jgi:phage baseplate assembly protein W|tara:strand:+ start:226 stop:630 length:405 start_codon:yes stop_codon:yes gene_type:complete
MLNKKINPLDFKDDVAIGLGLPMNSTTGIFKLNYVTEDQVHTNLRNLVMTMKGERIMHPTFGCGLYELLYEPAIQGNLSLQATDAVREAIAEWMPFVTINNVAVTFDGNVANVLISYAVSELDINKVLSMSVKV